MKHWSISNNLLRWLNLLEIKNWYVFPSRHHYIFAAAACQPVCSITLPRPFRCFKKTARPDDDDGWLSGPVPTVPYYFQKKGPPQVSDDDGSLCLTQWLSRKTPINALVVKSKQIHPTLIGNNECPIISSRSRTKAGLEIRWEKKGKTAAKGDRSTWDFVSSTPSNADYPHSQSARLCPPFPRLCFSGLHLIIVVSKPGGTSYTGGHVMSR